MAARGGLVTYATSKLLMGAILGADSVKTDPALDFTHIATGPAYAVQSND
jgi:hypothetical protein